MAAISGKSLESALSKEESDCIPEHIYAKIKTCFEETFEECLTYKALFETSKLKHEQKSRALEKELEESKNALTTDQTKLAAVEEKLKSLQTKHTDAETELITLRDSVEKLEYDNDNLKRKWNIAEDERDSLIKMVDRRSADVERLDSVVKNLTAELNAAINAKFEALAAADDVKSREAFLNFKEETMKTEKEYFKTKIENLTQDFNQSVTDMANLQKDHAIRLLTLQTQLAAKTEELRIAAKKDDQLTANNRELTARVETLAARIMTMRENESAMEDNYQQELESKTKLAELYKRMVNDSNGKIEELTEAIHVLQQLVAEAGHHCDELEAKRSEETEKHLQVVEAKNECIAALKNELSDANDLIEAIKPDTAEKTVDEPSPVAVAAGKFVKSGLTLTQVYSQYVSLGEELMVAKEENEKIKQSMNAIFKELEEKAPIMLEQHQNYEKAVECVTTLCARNDELINESQLLRTELNELKKSGGNYRREKDRLQQEVKDLSRQVCFLLKQIEEARGGVVTMDDDFSLNSSAGANDVISQRLVIFRDVEDLQAKNQQLLAILHVLSAKQEELENAQEDMNILMLQENIQGLNTEVKKLRESSSQQKDMLDHVVQQRDMYRDMYEKTLKGELPLRQEQVSSDRLITVESPQCQDTPKTASVCASVLSAKDQQIQELQKRLDAAEDRLKHVKAEYEKYRRERRTDEDRLTEKVDEWASQIRDLTSENFKLSTQVEYQVERYNNLKTNLASQKSQIAALEEKCSNYGSTIAKDEQSIKQLVDEVRATQAKLAKTEAEVKNLREENRLLRVTEARLLFEKESSERGSTSQALIMSNLESIKVALAKSESEGSVRLEQRLDEATRECTALRKRLQEEEERFRELAAALERNAAEAAARMEEERAVAEKARAELFTASLELEKKSALIEKLESKVREADIPQPPPPVVVQKKDDQLGVRVRQLESQLAVSESRLKLSREQLDEAKEHCKQFRCIAESSEKQVLEMTAVHKKEIGELRSALRNAENAEKELREKLVRLEERMAEIKAEKERSVAGLSQRAEQVESQLKSVVKEKELVEEEREFVRIQLDEMVAQLLSATDARKETEEKYAQEVVLHSNDKQVQEILKKEVDGLKAEIAELRSTKLKAEDSLAACQSKFEEEAKQRESEMKEMKERLEELSAQNNKLLDELHVIGKKLALAESMAPPSSSSEACGSAPDQGSCTQLVEVIDFLRRESHASAVQVANLSAENARLRSELDVAMKEVAEVKAALGDANRKGMLDKAISAQHQEILSKVERLDYLKESNRVLRNERDVLREKEQQLEQRVSEMQLKLAPLEEQNRSLTIRVDSAAAENAALNEVIKQLQMRTKSLIERANKTSPEDWKRLQNELVAEKEAHSKTREEARNARLEKAKLHEQQSAANRRTASLETARRVAQQKQDEELNALRAKVAGLESEMAQQQAENLSLTEKEAQVRRIARRYKQQFDEVNQKYEKLRKAMVDKEQAEAAAPGSALLSADAKEQLREEGRREAEERLRGTQSSQEEQIRGAEQRLTNQETAHNERLNQAREEVDTLRQENEALRQREENLRNVMQKVRTRLTTLDGDRTKLEQQLKEANNTSQLHLNDCEENKKRLSVLKSQYESKLARLEKERAEALAERGERERLQRELDTMTARCSLLQRQFDKQSGKPSTSSGSEKGSAEPPPTANIKPMAGPSSAVTKQQTHQAATVSPWRAGNETPLASIRPIQTRMAAVSPQTTSSHQSSTAVLAPVQPSPQQQIPTSQAQPQQQPLQQHQQASQIQAVAQQQQQQQPVQAVAPAMVATPQVAGPSQQALSTHQATDSVTATTALTSASGSMEATSSHTDFMPATSSAKQQLNVVPSTSRGEGPGAQSTQDMEIEGGSSRVNLAPIINVPQQASPTHANQAGQQSSPQVKLQKSPQQPQASLQRSTPIQQGQQHAVAMVLPRERNEQQIQMQQVVPQAVSVQAHPQQQSPQQPGLAASLAGTAPTEAPLQQAVSVASSQLASSSSTVTTSGSQGTKRPRDSEGEGSQSRTEPSKVAPQQKRSRRGILIASPGESFQAVESSDCGRLEVEYQVPTSSQRDQEDDVIVITTDDEDDDDDDDEDEPADDEEDEGNADDGLVEEGSSDEGGMDLEDNDGYAIESYDQVNYEEDNPDVDDANASGDNEVEIIDDSDEVPSQTGSAQPGRSDSSQAVGSSASLRSPQQPAQLPQHQQQIQQQLIQQQSSSSEATSSGVDNSNSGMSGIGGAGRNNQVTSQGLAFLGRGRTTNQQQLLLPHGYEGDMSDDSIVPSTPTLYDPRRTDADGFGVAVSSPQVPSAGRFTFSESNQPTTRTVAQVRCEGIDDTRMDLSQLEEPGTERSVPTTPLHVSPQGENIGSDLIGSASLGHNGESSIIVAVSEAGPSHSKAGPVIPTITVTGTDQQSRMVQESLEIEDRELIAEGERVEDPEEVPALEGEDDNGDGVSSEGQSLGQPLRPLAEEGREAEASTASSPHGGSHGSEIIARGGLMTRRTPRMGFTRRGRVTTRQKQPIVWNEAGSSSMSPRGGNSNSSSSSSSSSSTTTTTTTTITSESDPLNRSGPAGRGAMQNQAFALRGQRARRMRRPGFKGFPPY